MKQIVHQGGSYSICALNRDNPAKKAQPTHDCFLQNLIAFHFYKATNPPNPKSLRLRAYILCTQGDLIPIFPTIPNPVVKLYFHMKTDLGLSWVSNNR